jgi:hypothetical protein
MHMCATLPAFKCRASLYALFLFPDRMSGILQASGTLIATAPPKRRTITDAGLRGLGRLASAIVKRLSPTGGGSVSRTGNPTTPLALMGRGAKQAPY